MAVARDTRHRQLAADERLNYFPATSCFTISLFFEGETILTSTADGSGASGARLSQVALFGPHRGPIVSVNPGPVHALTVAIYSDAFHALTGADVSRLVDCNLPGEAVLPAAIMAACRAALESGDATSAFDIFQGAMAPLWQAARPSQGTAAINVLDWAQRLTRYAATSGVGRSLRQIERRVLNWTGQTQRDLMVLRRAEQTLLSVLERMGAEREDWSKTAVDNGYADQAHMIREVRRVTGLPPAQLRRRIKTHSAFWCYRLLGELG